MLSRISAVGMMVKKIINHGFLHIQFRKFADKVNEDH